MEVSFSQRIQLASQLVLSLLVDLDSETDLAACSGEDVVAVRRLVDRTDLLCAAMVAQMHQDGKYADDGYRSVGDWLAAKAGVRAGEGSQRLRQAGLLSQLPRFGAAVLAGDVTLDHVKILVGAVTPERLALALRDEQLLTRCAVERDASMFMVLVRKWVACADDALSDPTGSDEQHENRRLQLTQHSNGTWNLNASLPSLCGEILHAAITAAMPKLTSGETRTLTQLRHDALVDVAAESLTNTDRQQVGNERPNVNLVVHVADGSSHTPNMVYLSSFVRDMVMCDAKITPIKIGFDGQMFDVGTPESAIPVRNRTAIVVRDRCCRMPGCGRSPRWCQIHHIRERENGGTHELSNLVLVCTFHHRQIHRDGLKLAWDADGLALLVTLPGGATLHGPPHPATSCFHSAA
jgi:hypothetical protein